MYNSIEEYSKDLISVKEVCELLHISVNGLAYRIKKQGFPKRKEQGYLSRTEILKWIEEKNGN